MSAPRTASTSDARKRKAERQEPVVDVRAHGGQLGTMTDPYRGAEQTQPVVRSRGDSKVEGRDQPVTLTGRRSPTTGRYEPEDEPPALPDTSTAVALAEIIREIAGRKSDNPDADALEIWECSKQIIAALTPPPASPEPWGRISTDRERPTLARINGTVAEFFVEGNMLKRVVEKGNTAWSRYLDTIESVELLHTYSPDTHVSVERALIDEAVGAKRVAEPWGPLYDVVNALAALADGVES